MGRRLLAASLADDPEAGYQHALEARRLAARVGIVRETAGIAAYRAGHWAEALAELRAARRLTGRTSYLPMMADSERALGRIDRALGVVAEAARTKLDRETEVELRIVESGIRRDQGLADAAVVVLQLPELRDAGSGPGRLACSTRTRTPCWTRAAPSRRGSGSPGPRPRTPTS